MRRRRHLRRALALRPPAAPDRRRLLARLPRSAHARSALVAMWGRGLGWWGGPGRDETDHAAVLEATARALRGGRSLPAALREAAAVSSSGQAGADLDHCLRLLDRGAGVVAVVDEWAGDRPGAARVLSAATVALGAEVGGAAARSLDATASSLRDRAGLEREVRALTSQARASAGLMVLAPVGFGAYTWVTDPRVARLVVLTPLGWACLGAGLGLDLMGAAWMARLAGSVT